MTRSVGQRRGETSGCEPECASKLTCPLKELQRGYNADSGGAEDPAQCAATVVGVERSEIYCFKKSLQSEKRDTTEAWRVANEVGKKPVSRFGVPGVFVDESG